MSFSMLMFFVGCAGMYKLGTYNQRHPGEVWKLAHAGWQWMNK